MGSLSPAQTRAWWKSAVIYQIYPISFFDSNNDGFGDLNGIYEKLGYLKDLGVDVLWLSPIYRSPLADMGYDISDYRDIDPRYGTLEDWDRLLKGVHDHGMKLMMDLVVNHTSNEHDWFVNSRSSKDDPKRDWYIWRPPKFDAEGKRLPPNNWKSVFQGSAWDFDEKTEEYYLHLYVTEQPDLNWENPTVRDAVWDVMRFWIDRGCDGFRMDVINIISKVEGLPDAPVVDPDQYYQDASMYFANGPRVHEYIKQMNTEVLSHHDLITVGETPFTHDASQLAAYVLPKNKELNMVFHFELMDLDSPDYSALIHKDWKLTELKAVIQRWQRYKRDEGFWNAVFIENHDHSRSVSRFGNDSDKWRVTSAKMLSILEIAQTGTLYVYQGQELGMKNFPRSWGIDEYKDVASQNYWNLIKGQRKKASGSDDVDMSDLLDNFQRKARDHARTPMQWDSTPHAGFTTGTPWMRVNDDYEACNVSVQTGDEDSVWSFWKRALAARKQHDVLIYGDFEMLLPSDEQVFAFTRTLGEASALVVLNFQEAEKTVSVFDNDDFVGGYRLLLSNYGDVPKGLTSVVTLKGYEGRLYIK
ncbi:glycoside hydrolase family 13 protein [Hygrophoropsis aurantiaca]|uniref:Glycoside hydrolase family 13 protein n=1 Tax=Hygrophoropsis aurantiaca TaxID=72124 RepID=A0ACB7ZZG5_9AGAM|nr:glycoside hydrolase family 13 protein [Hygrophoropsis aurantiaca]